MYYLFYYYLFACIELFEKTLTSLTAGFFILGGIHIYNSKRFGLVASNQEYQMLCRAERHLKQKKKPTGQRLLAFNIHKNK